MKLNNRKALITGGAIRLGRAIAESLAAQGVDLVIHYQSSRSQAETLRDELSSTVQCHILQADLSHESDCAKLIEESAQKLQGLDILINNASVFNKQRFSEVDSEAIQTEFSVNTWAPLHLIREFAKLKPSKGDVINLLDRRIQTHDTACVPYLLSKQALAEITRLAAIEYAPQIRVNGVGPGPILPPPGKTEEHLIEHGGKILLERRPNPNDIAEAVLFFLTNPTVTGQILFIDSGQHLLGAHSV